MPLTPISARFATKPLFAGATPRAESGSPATELGQTLSTAQAYHPVPFSWVSFVQPNGVGADSLPATTPAEGENTTPLREAPQPASDNDAPGHEGLGLLPELEEGSGDDANPEVALFGEDLRAELLERGYNGGSTEEVAGAVSDTGADEGELPADIMEQIKARFGDSPFSVLSGRFSLDGADEAPGMSGESAMEDPQTKLARDLAGKVLYSSQDLRERLSDRKTPYAHLQNDLSPQLWKTLQRQVVNNIVLQASERRQAYGLMVRLQTYMLEQENLPLILMSMREGMPRREPIFNGGRLVGAGFYAVTDLEVELTKGLREKYDPDPDKPFVVYMTDLNSYQLDRFTSQESLEKLRILMPNLRLILNATEDEVIPMGSSSNAEAMQQQLMSMSMSMAPGGQAPATEAESWHFESFENVVVPEFTPREKAVILLQETEAGEIFQHYQMQFDESTLVRLISVLNRENGKALNLSALRAELDAFGTHFKATPHADKQVTGADIDSFLRNVMRPRKGKVVLKGSPMMESLVRPCFEVIPAGELTAKLSDVVGLEDAQRVIRTVLAEQEDADLFDLLNPDGPSKPTGVLMSGPPGCGKTFLAQAVAGEAQCTFLKMNAADVVQSFVGTGSTNVTLIERAIQNSEDDLVILFIEEVDALSKRAKNGAAQGTDGGAKSEQDKSINKFLDMLDGIRGFNKKVLILGATNRPNNLDEALKKRFQHKLKVGKPTAESRIQILKQELRKHKLQTEPTLNFDTLATSTDNMSGRELYTLVHNLHSAKKAKLLAPERKNFASDVLYEAAKTELKRLKQTLREDVEARKAFMTATQADFTQALASLTQQSAKKGRKIGFGPNSPA